MLEPVYNFQEQLTRRTKDQHRQRQAFETAGPGGQTLRAILESSYYPKVFFDARNDSDALNSHFEIGLRGVVDLQLLEFTSRPQRGRLHQKRQEGKLLIPALQLLASGSPLLDS
jgi:3'-5' exonuclease